MAGRRFFWTQLQVDYLIRRFEVEQASFGQIAEEMGMTHDQIRAKVSTLRAEGLIHRFMVRRKRKKKKNKRVCLKCDREFMSEGIYNRICTNCNESNANVGQTETYSVDAANYG